VEHRIAVVVVHYVKRPPHALRNLLDEAEWAGVLADANPVKGWIGEGDAPELIAWQFQVEPAAAIAAQDLDPDRLGLRVELEIERVEDRHAVDRGDAVAFEQADL